MERISKKRRAKSEKPQFPKLRSKYGVNRSFTFSLRAWFNFKLFAVILIALIALAVITFTQLEPADFSGEKFTDAFYTYDGELNTAALLYTICLVATIIFAVIFLVLVVKLILTAFKVSSMRLDFYDDVVVWRWGRVFKCHIEQRFIGVYDVLVMPGNKLYYKDSLEKKKPAKFGTVLAKVPGGGYEWNRKFFGVKEYIELKNYLESKKITERFERPRSNFHDDSI